MGAPRHSLETLRPLSEGELNEWEEAYAAVEAYLQALRLRNRLLVAELVRRILWRASERRVNEPDKPARLLAMNVREAEGRAGTVRSNQRSSNTLYCRVNVRVKR
jgi:hypothetical protein